jgi:prevent-host-death family protein
MEQISIEDARRTLGEIVDQARLAGRPTVITRQGRPAAVVVSLEWHRQASDAIRRQVRGDLGEIAAAGTTSPQEGGRT